METPNSYCKAVESGKLTAIHKTYHDTRYGFPAQSDNELFGRLLLEINQAGLSWNVVLTKQDTIKKAYADFDIKAVANFGAEDITRLRNDAGVIRNRLKINAAIYNAQQILVLQQKHGSFANWLDVQHPKTIKEWVKCFKKTFKFTGGEITKEFLMGTGYLKGAHDENCPIYQKTLKVMPKWLNA